MLRTVLATIAGILIGGIIIAVVEMIGHMIYPPPSGVDMKDPEQVKAIMGTIPFGAKFAVLIAWFLGILGGGIAGVLISQRKALPATIVALVLLAGAIATMFMIPHPVWMIVGAFIATALGWFGATRLADG